MMEELRRLLAESSTGDQCRAVSPDGFYCCIIRKGHEGDCRNPSAGVSWCGYCSAWTCRKPEVHAGKTP